MPFFTVTSVKFASLECACSVPVSACSVVKIQQVDVSECGEGTLLHSITDSHLLLFSLFVFSEKDAALLSEFLCVLVCSTHCSF